MLRLHQAFAFSSVLFVSKAEIAWFGVHEGVDVQGKLDRLWRNFVVLSGEYCFLNAKVPFSVLFLLGSCICVARCAEWIRVSVCVQTWVSLCGFVSVTVTGLCARTCVRACVCGCLWSCCQFLLFVEAKRKGYWMLFKYFLIFLYSRVNVRCYLAGEYHSDYCQVRHHRQDGAHPLQGQGKSTAPQTQSTEKACQSRVQLVKSLYLSAGVESCKSRIFHQHTASCIYWNKMHTKFLLRAHIIAQRMKCTKDQRLGPPCIGTNYSGFSVCSVGQLISLSYL